MTRPPTGPMTIAIACALAAIAAACAAPVEPSYVFTSPAPDISPSFGDASANQDGAALGDAATSADTADAGAADIDGGGHPLHDAVPKDHDTDGSLPTADGDGEAPDGAEDSDGAASDASAADAEEPDVAIEPDASANDAEDADVDAETDPGATDAGTTDGDAEPPDGGADTTPDTGSGLGPPAAGQLVITEIHADPAAVTDANGEWFEVCNVAGKSLSLEAVVIGDATALTDPTKAHAVVNGGSLTIPAGGCFVFAAKGSALVNGGVTPGYAYNGAFALNNSGTESLFVRAGAVVIDQVSFSPKAGGWPAMSPGASYMLDGGKTSASANDDGTAWCITVNQKFGAGDAGTPGLPNGPCL